MLTVFKCQEKKEEEDLIALKRVLMLRSKDQKTAWKCAEGGWLQPPETMMTTRRQTEGQLPENKNGKKKNSMDILGD